MLPLPAHQTKDVPLLTYPITPFRTVQLVQKAPLDSVSTGTTLYLSSQLLAHYLQDTTPKGVTAIELGSGTGLVSIALGILGWEVWATDLKLVIDDVLRVNIERNREEAKIVVQELDWCSDNWDWVYPQNEELRSDGIPEFDLIVCADGVYSMDLILPLLRTLKKLSQTRSPLILLAFERRDSGVIDCFFEESKAFGFVSKKVNIRRILGRQIARWGWTSDDWHSVEIWTMRLKAGDTREGYA